MRPMRRRVIKGTGKGHTMAVFTITLDIILVVIVVFAERRHIRKAMQAALDRKRAKEDARIAQAEGTVSPRGRMQELVRCCKKALPVFLASWAALLIYNVFSPTLPDVMAYPIGYIPYFIMLALNGRSVLRKRLRPVKCSSRLLWAAILGISGGGVLGYVLFDPAINGTASVGSAAASYDFVGPVLYAPIVEELMFRGMLLDGDEDKRMMLAVSAVTFMSVHVTNSVSMPLALMIGLTAGMIRLATGSVFPGIVLHALTNLATLMTNYTARIALMGGWPSGVVMTACSIFLLVLEAREKDVFGNEAQPSPETTDD